MAQSSAGGDAPAGTVTVEERVEEREGEVHVHRVVREWQPRAPETLPEIEAEIDSWGRRQEGSTARAPLDPDELAARVDRVTRRVKGTRRMVVQETVTEWVEAPREEPAPAPQSTFHEVEPVAMEPARPPRPQRRFRVLGFVGRKPRKEEPRDRADPGYQPQCSALTADGAQCRNSARDGSRYCASHKGYQPPTAKGLAQRIEGDAWDPRDDVTDRESVASADTRPRVGKAKDTKVRVRKRARSGGRRR